MKRKKTDDEPLKSRACVDGRDQFLDEVLRSADRHASTSGLAEVKKALPIAARFGLSIESWDAFMAYLSALLEDGLATPAALEDGLPAERYPPAGHAWALLRALRGAPAFWQPMG